MKTTVFFTTLLGLSLSAALHNPELVVGGTPAERGQFPFYAALRVPFLDEKKGSTICGASIIGDRFLLTAWHCVRPDVFEIDKNITAVLGTVQLGNLTQNGTQIFPNVRAILHDNNPASMFFDIALLELDRPIQFNELVQPIKLVRNDTNLLQKGGEFMGFGTTTSPYPGYTSDLVYVDLKYVDNSNCSRELFPRRSGNLAGMDRIFCAGGIGKIGNYGDSGGPLVQSVNGTFVQLGILSFGAGDPEISVFTRVSFYCDFIAKNTNGAVKCS